MMKERLVVALVVVFRQREAKNELVGEVNKSVVGGYQSSMNEAQGEYY